MIVDSKGRLPAQQLYEGKNKVVLSFRPDKESYRGGSIGDYEIVFALRQGVKGEDVKAKATLRVADKPYKPN